MSEHTPEPIELPDNWPTHREAMLAGKLYNPADPELVQLRERSADLCWQFNMTRPTDHTTRAAVLHQLLGAYGKDCELLGPIQFDYGCFTTLGDRVFINYNCTVLDCAYVTIGDDVLIGPNVSILPPMHPLRWQDRNIRYAQAGQRDGLPAGSTYDYEYGLPITIERNCWIGGNVTIVGGVTIGEGSVIGAGAVVTHDIPPHSLAVGVPAKVIRAIDDRDDASALHEYAQLQ